MDSVKIERYPAYKDSGVEWLGEIPEGWKLLPGFTIVSERNEKNIGLKEKTVLSLSYGSIVIKPEDKLTGLVPESFETYQLVYPNDIVVRPMDLQNDKISLRIGLSFDKGIISNAYLNLRIEESNDYKFFYYFLHAVDITKVIYGLGSGLRQNLSFLDFKRFKFLVPPKVEQTAIASFLDRKTALIDQAIGIKQKQIELLKERRQILIHKAVTRGLNPNVKMKESGVEWIGEVPEGWEVSRLKNHIEMLTGYPFKSEKYTEVGIKLARGINVKEGVFNWDETRYWPIVENHLDRYLLKDGDILIAMDGSKVGKNFCQVKAEDLPILLLQRVARLRTTSKLNSSFLFNHIVNRNFLLWVEMTKTDPMVPHIAPTDIYNFQITVPPLLEQKNISEFIEISASKIATAITLKEQEIEKLKEYKATLINSAVTGKIKVS